ncbi:ATP-dependent endonuclease [Nocardia sp. NPDC127606]|uniref:ATP-dependent nuclease n=1 Tax=Nocardia sp. NPDC127606 TaxID=3345406 RepID=UPI003624E158
MHGAEHDALAKMWHGEVFEPAIRHIRFPLFRNLSTNLTIEFNHPITAITGPNGSNKSAILRALQGCPRGNDLGKYWFGTAVDVIPVGERHRFIYGRYSKSTNGIVEVIKTRIGRRRDSRSGPVADPDLFEPSRPLTTAPDNMDKFIQDVHGQYEDASRTRWATISKDVLYIDFRAQLSAFDWAMNHADVQFDIGTPQEEFNLVNARKKVLRNRTSRLSKALINSVNSDVYFNIERIMHPILDMPKEQKTWVERILGKEYSRIRLIQHRYFGRPGGWTVILESPKGLKYSEAFAGSGEYAVALLVHRISGARERSLILLDEPEVSLHPYAQRQVVSYLGEVAKLHKHQIVFATHSSEMIRDLPPTAVKVLTVRASDGKVDIPVQDSAPQFAFDAIGAHYDHPTIVVEDRLAAQLVEQALEGHPGREAVQVKYLPGGADTLWTYYVPMWAQEKRTDLLLLLDGDQIVTSPRPVDEIPPGELEAEIVKTFKGKAGPQLPFSASDAGSTAHRIESVKCTLEWRRRFVRFLPCWTPERFLWDYRVQDPTSPTPATATANGKDSWREFTKAETSQSDAATIYTFQLQALRRVERDCATMIEIRGIVDEFIGSL